MLCWRNVEITLVTGIVSTTRYSVSNAAGHLRSNHQRHEIPDMYTSDISTVTQSVSQSEKGSNLVQSTINPSQLQFKPIGTPQVALSHLYSFFNEASVAIEQSSNLHLNSFINYVLENAMQIHCDLKKLDRFFSRWKYKKQ